MVETKLKGKLPEGDANGLKGDVWRKRLVEQPLQPHVAIVIFDAPTATKNYETAEEIPSVRLLAIEPFSEQPSADMLMSMLRETAAKRTGVTELDFEAPTEDDEL